MGDNAWNDAVRALIDIAENQGQDKDRKRVRAVTEMGQREQQGAGDNWKPGVMPAGDFLRRRLDRRL